MRQPPYLKIGAMVLILAAILLILNLTPLSGGFKNFFYFVSSPIQKKLWEVGDRTSNFISAIADTQNLKRENEELKFKIQELVIENISLRELEKENENLRTALNIGLEKEFKLAIAQVIGKDISQDFILIDKGSKDGILKGLAVITPQKVLVGKISEVNDSYSKVMLVSNQESSYGVETVNTQILGEAKGEGNFQLLLDLIPLDVEIKKGDLMITTSLTGIPKGLLVGEISEVKKIDVEPFQQADIKPAFDIKDIDRLFIVLSF